MNNKDTESPEPTWRSDKAHAAICEAAELIANHYCSEDDTYSLEVERLTAAISRVIDRADHSAAPAVNIWDDDRCMFCGGKTAHKLDCNHGRPAPAAPDEAAAPSDAWRQWFAQVGEAATVNVVNATATLVIAERAIMSPADEADKALAQTVVLSEREVTRIGSQIVGDVLAQIGVRGSKEEREGADLIAAAWVAKVVERITDELPAALAQARKETWEKAIRVAQLSAQKSEKASLDIAAAEILIRRLELAARDGRGKENDVDIS